METVEVVEEIVEEIDNTINLVRKEYITNLAVVSVVSGVVGGVVSYYICKKMMKTKYEEISKKEIAEAKAFYSVVNKEGSLSTPENAVKALIPEKELRSLNEAAKSLKRYQGDDSDDEEKVHVDYTRQVADPEWDIEVELANRSEEDPYVISQEEFMNPEPGFDQSSLTYYVGDGTLADERDEEIPFIDPIIGENNLERFGQGSGDPRIVYIRNERLSSDFEISKNDNKYAHVVLGFEHSHGTSRERQRRKQIRKFKGDDE